MQSLFPKPLETRDFKRLLRQAKRGFQTLFDNSNDAIFVVDDRRKVLLQCNRYAEQLIGIPRDAIIDKALADVLPLYSDCRAHFQDREDLDPVESICRNSQGDPIPVMMKILPLGFPNKDSNLVIMKSVEPVSDNHSSGNPISEERKETVSTPCRMVTKTRSSTFKKTLDAARKVAKTDSFILIRGETGTGKELMARFLHECSSRVDQPFIKVNCAALPENLIESELFGHEKGAFTGASKERIGRFERAHGGILLLDEIGDLHLSLQIKLLRAIQEQVIERIGGKKSIPVNVRIFAATHQNLEAMIATGDFRSDLYYRLNVFPLHLSPLRERKEDIPDLADFFIQKHRSRLKSRVQAIPKATVNRLQNYSWPGNIRELENIVERSLVLSEGRYLKIPDDLLLETNINDTSPTVPQTPTKPTLRPLKELEMEAIREAIQCCNGIIEGKRGAARRLGIPPSTLRDRMREFGITK